LKNTEGWVILLVYPQKEVDCFKDGHRTRPPMQNKYDRSPPVESELARFPWHEVALTPAWGRKVSRRLFFPSSYHIDRTCRVIPNPVLKDEKSRCRALEATRSQAGHATAHLRQDARPTWGLAQWDRHSCLSKANRKVPREQGRQECPPHHRKAMSVPLFRFAVAEKFVLDSVNERQP